MREVRDWWLPLAKALRVGSSSKILHLYDTPYKSKSVLIYNTDLGYGAKCFRRGTSDWVFKEHLSLEALANEAVESGKDDLPNDLEVYTPTNTDRVTQLANWYLLKRGLDPMMVYNYNTYLSKSRLRLVYRCVGVDGVVGYIGRDITEKHHAKVVTYMHNSKRLKHAVFSRPTSSPSRSIIVEDVNSAIKLFDMCKRAGYNIEVVSLNGTSGSDQLSLHLMDKDVILWLDGDIAGERGAVKLFKDLTPLANSVKIIRGRLDPKEYDSDVVLDLIWEVTNDTQGIKSWVIADYK